MSERFPAAKRRLYEKHAAWFRDQHAPGSARLTHLRLPEFRHSLYTGSGLLDHLNRNGFDCRSDRPRGFFHGRAFGLSPGGRSLRHRLSSRSFG